jgi:hypothetical protein
MHDPRPAQNSNWPYPVFVPRGEDGHSWPFPASAGIRPGIYAGYTGGRDPNFAFVPAVRPVYGSPSFQYSPVPCRRATAEIIDRPERITEIETALLGRNPVNGVDITDSAKQKFHASRRTRHECRADYGLKPKTGENARASWPLAEQKRRHAYQRIIRVSLGPHNPRCPNEWPGTTIDMWRE